MYYYEFTINDIDKIYKSKIKYSEVKLKRVIEDYINNYDGYIGDLIYNLLNHLATNYGVFVHHPKIKKEFDINLDYYKNHYG